MSEWLPVLEHFGYLGVLVMLALAGAPLPVPQDLTLLLCGALAHRGVLRLEFVVPVAMLGCVASDVLFFVGGRALRGTADGTADGPANGTAAKGQPVRRGRFAATVRRLLTPERLTEVRRQIDRRGAWTIVVSRHVAGLRSAVAAAAGAIDYPLPRYALWDLVAAVPNVAVMMGLGWVFSDRLDVAARDAARLEHGLAALGLAVAILVVLVTAWRRQRRHLGEATPQ